MRHRNNRRLQPVWALVPSLTIATATFAGGNLLTNASFEIEGPNGGFTELTGISALGPAGADNWFVFHNTQGTTVTEVDPVFVPPGGGAQSLRVITDGQANGIEQVMSPTNTGPACVRVSAWVWVNRGQVYIGAGNGGNTGPNAFSTTTNQWEQLIGENQVCPANLFIVYSNSPGGADFFVDLASVTVLDCIGPPGDLNEDGFVNAADLALLLGAWGPCMAGDPCPADLNNNGVVNAADLAILLGNWGC